MAFAGVFSDTSSDSTPDSFLDSSSASGGGDTVDVADVGLSTLVSSLLRPPLPDPELGGAAVATAVGSTSEPKPSDEPDATASAPGLPADSSPNDGDTGGPALPSAATPVDQRPLFSPSTSSDGTARRPMFSLRTPKGDEAASMADRMPDLSGLSAESPTPTDVPAVAAAASPRRPMFSLRSPVVSPTSNVGSPSQAVSPSAPSFGFPDVDPSSLVEPATLETQVAPPKLSAAAAAAIARNSPPVVAAAADNGPQPPLPTAPPATPPGHGGVPSPSAPPATPPSVDPAPSPFLVASPPATSPPIVFEPPPPPPPPLPVFRRPVVPPPPPPPMPPAPHLAIHMPLPPVADLSSTSSLGSDGPVGGAREEDALYQIEPALVHEIFHANVPLLYDYPVEDWDYIDDSQRVMQDLPPEILSRVFMFLDARSLTNVLQVCRFWYNIGSDDPIWRVYAGSDNFRLNTPLTNHGRVPRFTWKEHVMMCFNRERLPILEQRRREEEQRRITHFDKAKRSYLRAAKAREIGAIGVASCWVTILSMFVTVLLPAAVNGSIRPGVFAVPAIALLLFLNTVGVCDTRRVKKEQKERLMLAGWTFALAVYIMLAWFRVDGLIGWTWWVVNLPLNVALIPLDLIGYIMWKNVREEWPDGFRKYWVGAGVASSVCVGVWQVALNLQMDGTIALSMWIHTSPLLLVCALLFLITPVYYYILSDERELNEDDFMVGKEYCAMETFLISPWLVLIVLTNVYIEFPDLYSFYVAMIPLYFVQLVLLTAFCVTFFGIISIDYDEAIETDRFRSRLPAEYRHLDSPYISGRDDTRTY